MCGAKLSRSLQPTCRCHMSVERRAGSGWESRKQVHRLRSTHLMGIKAFFPFFFPLTAAVLGVIHVIYHLLKMCNPGVSDVFLGLCKHHHSQF